MSIDKLHDSPIAYFHVRKTDLGPDFAVFPDFRIPFQPGAGIQDGITANLHALFHIRRSRIHDSDAFIHELSNQAAVHDALGFCQVAAGVDAHDHVKVPGLDTCHMTAFLQAFCQDICQIIFTLGIIIGQVGQQVKQ